MKAGIDIRNAGRILILILVLISMLFLIKAIVEYKDPTPGQNEYRNKDWVFVNVTDSDAAGTYSFINWNESLVLWLSMEHNESGTVYDNSSYGNDGTAFGKTNKTAGRFGNAFGLDGETGYIESTVSQDKHTVSFWYKNTTELNWTHVVNASGTLYVNGVIGAPGQYPVYISGDTIQAGKLSGSSYFNGSIDELLIFNRNLSYQEVLALYNSSKYEPYHNFTSLEDGLYNYTAYSVNESGDADNAGYRNVTIDTLNPGINFTSPTAPSGRRNVDWIAVNITADDPNPENITIFLYNSTDLIISNSSGGNNFFWNITSLDSGIYYINSSANDIAGNINSTPTREVIIDMPAVINLHASVPPYPAESDEVYIYANVTDDNDDVRWVNFTIAAPNGTVIINNENASSRNGNIWNSSKLNASSLGRWMWNITAYDNFSVTFAEGSFNIAIWHTFVGNLSGSLQLADEAGSSLVRWNVENVSGSNIYIADSDSSINFNSLAALGRNLSNASTINDFEELDDFLATGNYTDSINSTYTFSGNVKKEYNFTVFGKTIYYVPIVNSTNNSNFFTGILWDSSDDTNNGGEEGEYEKTAKEDIVFITEASKGELGKYGVYDYEIKIPAKLREYVSAGSSVSLYGEIR
ncbi:hypothetical protein GF323_03915 [Candidatus Woesearchaeota archaeon]|nr:hypothetical protein [Candidatus Woesearchaeota archaeon]